MTDEELLKAGIAAVQNGDLEQASKLLIQVVKTNPQSELGWLWLGRCRTDAKQREFCFQKVLEINPQNQDARRQVEVLRQLARNEHSKENKQPEAPGSPPLRRIPPLQDISNSQTISDEKPTPSSRVDKSIPQRQIKNNNTLFAWIGIGLVALICIGIVGLFIFRQAWLPRISPPVVNVPAATATVAVVLTPDYDPSFEPGPCHSGLPSEVNITCGFVIVPEDRRGDLFDTIKLAVAIYHHTGDGQPAEPILYLQGGPGDEAVSWSADVYESVIAPQLGDRDFIVFDPRGVGYSEPLLDCDAIRETYLGDIQGRVPDNQRSSYYEGALLTCKNDLLKRGVNLSAYTSEQMAWDARDVILALGYQNADLYGISYGTRIAQLVMRDHPEAVRSAILDSVVPIETQMYDQVLGEQNQAIQTIFEDCKASPSCSSAYPDLESVYNETAGQLNTTPVKASITIPGMNPIEQPIDGSTFRNVITWMLRSPQTIEVIPQMIYRVHGGDTSILLLSAAIPVYAFDSISIGTYISVNCRDQIFQMSMEKLDKTIRDMCKVWDVKAPLPGENDPVVSEIPTLIFAGRYDPVTPVSLADQLATHLSHSQVIVIPDQGHAPTATGVSDCPAKLMQSFLRDPNIPLDMACVTEIKSVQFAVPFDPNTPLSFEPVVIEQYHVTTQIPFGWDGVEFGFYNRNGSYGDITQVGIQRATVTQAEWAAWLMTNFRGNHGFDQSPTKYEERQANGLTWSLYRTTSEGLPVNIAFAKSGKDTLMVLMISYPDEQEALYNSLFLPILDSTKSSL
jgi:pimeloyl-ACP methyl ester carboxylesterase